MAAKRKSPPSPIRAGLKHAGLSLVTFAVITGAMAGFIQLTGKAETASPTQIVGLFDGSQPAVSGLKNRLSDDHHGMAANHDLINEADPEHSGLDVDDLSDGPEDGDGDTGEPEPNTTNASESTRPGLPKAPIEGVWEWSGNGRLPMIAEDGRKPMDVYKRPFSNPAGRPTISIVVGGLGLNSRVTQAAIDELPPEVTLSFVPYSRGLQTWVDKARAAGHEVMIEMPMEPYDYPNNDTGPYTLLTTADADENRRRSLWVISQATGYFGVTNYQGAKYATDSRAITPVFELLSDRGLAFIHDGSAPRSTFETVSQKTGLPFAEAARVIDSDPTSAAIDEQLLHLEAISLQRGHALGTGFAFPITIDQLRDWTATLESKGYVLAPASAHLRIVPDYQSDMATADHDGDTGHH